MYAAKAARLRKTQSGLRPLWVLLRHIFAFARNCFAVSLSQKQKRHLPLERYATLGLNWLENILKKKIIIDIILD